jgi:hypothetical protein
VVGCQIVRDSPEVGKTDKSGRQFMSGQIWIFKTNYLVLRHEKSNILFRNHKPGSAVRL